MNGKDFLSIRDFSPSEIHTCWFLAVKLKLTQPPIARLSGVRPWP